MNDTNMLNGMMRMVERVTFPFTMLAQGPIALNDYFSHVYLEPEITLMDPAAMSAEHGQGSLVKIHGRKQVLTGAMGAGKSTYLLWLYDKHLKDFLQNKSNLEPFIFSLPHYLEDPKIAENLTNNADKLVVFVDSLDETVLSFDNQQIDQALDFFLKLPSVIIACRSPFFYKLFNPRRRGNLDSIIELKPLSLDTQQQIIEKYMKSPYLIGNGAKNGSEKTAIQIVERCRKKNVAETTITATPLFSALTSIVAVKSNSLNQLKGVTDVYQLFIKDIIARKFDARESEKLLEVAFRLNSVHMSNSPFFLDEIGRDYGDAFKISIQDILQTDPSNLYHDREIVVDFRHRSIGEYLLARYIVAKLNGEEVGGEVLSAIFDRLFNYEVSFFIRSLFEEISTDWKGFVNEAFWTYINNNITARDERTILSVHNCMYFSRFLVVDWKSYAQGIADLMYKKRRNIHPLVMGTFLSGVIGCEAITIQERFLKENMEERMINRNLNYYLFYYGDSEYRNPPDFVREISDTTSWDSTRSVLLTRLKDDTPKKRFFRCHDLIILRQFLQRAIVTVPPNDLAKITEIVAQGQKLLIGTTSPKLKNSIVTEINNITVIIKTLEKNTSKSVITEHMEPDHTYIIFISPNLGYEEGGVNSFNFEFAKALARYCGEISGYKIICMPYVDPVTTKERELKESGGQVLSLGKTTSDVSFGNDLPLITKMIKQLPESSHLVFVGHDSLTGELSNYVARHVFTGRSTSVVFHHMDYQSYYAIKGEDIKKTAEKIKFQEDTISSAEIIFGVGPKLFESAKRMVNPGHTAVYQLNPGLPDIPVKTSGPRNLVAITFGRYDKKTDNLKQMKLAATSFVTYVTKYRDEAKRDATLNIIGISTDSEASELESVYKVRTNRALIVNNIPYSEDRKTLFRKLASSSISLMLSLHEGFGLAGLEAIAAGVPLILSRNTGLLEFLEQQLPECDITKFGIYPVEILGALDGHINEEDEAEVVKAFSYVWTNHQSFKTGILSLREILSEKMSWEKACKNFISAIGDFRKTRST